MEKTASASKAGLSASEKAANQLQIDSILQTIDRNRAQPTREMEEAAAQEVAYPEDETNEG